MTRRSSRPQGKGSNFFQSYLETMSTSPNAGIEPRNSGSKDQRWTKWANTAYVQLLTPIKSIQLHYGVVMFLVKSLHRKWLWKWWTRQISVLIPTKQSRLLPPLPVIFNGMGSPAAFLGATTILGCPLTSKVFSSPGITAWIDKSLGSLISFVIMLVISGAILKPSGGSLSLVVNLSSTPALFSTKKDK